MGGFAHPVQSEHNEDDLAGYRMVQALAVLVAGGTFWAAYLMSRAGMEVYLGLRDDPYVREITVGAWVGIPTALAGAIVAYLAAYERRWDLVRLFATLLLAANALIPLAWGVCWLMKSA